MCDGLLGRGHDLQPSLLGSPSQVDEMAARTLVQKGMSTQTAPAREKLYLAAVAALYQGADRTVKKLKRVEIT
jgi:hypothetical protein